MLDAAGVTSKVKELHEANNAKKTEVCFMFRIYKAGADLLWMSSRSSTS